MRSQRLVIMAAVSLFSVLVAQEASAYYHVPLGRWLTRDPAATSAGRIGSRNTAMGAGAKSELLSMHYGRFNTPGYVDGFNLFEYAGSSPTIRVDPSGTTFGSPSPGTHGGTLACKIWNMAVAGIEWAEWEQRGIPHHPPGDNSGHNAMFHCLIACQINDSFPQCNDEWNDREIPVLNLGNQMDLGNNYKGQNNPGRDCWQECYDDWNGGNLSCQIDGGLGPCPPPPPNFPPRRPDPPADVEFPPGCP